MRKTLRNLFGVAVIYLAGYSSAYATSVLSYHYGSNSNGVDSTETLLTPANVNTTSFAKRYATGVDGQVYAQPLYVPGVTVIGGAQAGVHNLAFVATQHDSLYAIDIDSGSIIWKTSFLTTGLPGATTITSMPAGDSASSDTSPEIGICGTPVIDPSTNILYVAAKTKQVFTDTTQPHYVYTLYKIDITNGNATANANILGSTVIANTIWSSSTASYTYNSAIDPTAPQDPFVFGTGDGAITVNGTSRVYFNTMRQMNRPGMLLYNGSLYLAFGSHGDNGPYHGWMLVFDKGTLAITGVINLTPNGGLGGCWGGGATPVVDANGAIYMMTGNGTFDGYNNNGVAAGLDSLGFPVNGDYGDSEVKMVLDPTTSSGNQNKNGWGIKVSDYFSPFNSQSLNSSDTDLGSGGATLLPDSAGNSIHPHLLACMGKQGNLYLIDRDTMGKFTALTDNVVQSIAGFGACFNTPSYFNGTLYVAGEGDTGKSFALSNATMSTTQVVTPDSFSWPGSTATISANGTTNGIMWNLDRSSAQLRAYDAFNINHELWTSASVTGGSDALDSMAKFTTPTVADGRVLVGTQRSLTVYGSPVAATAAPAAPTALMAASPSSLEIDLSWTDNSTNENGFAIEQSSDGVNFTQVGTSGVNISTFPVIKNLQANTTFYFRVRAYNSFNGSSYSAYSNVVSAKTLSTAAAVNYISGFASTAGLTIVGSTAVVNNRAELTGNVTFEGGALWTSSVQNIQRFTTSFTFQLINPIGDGITFCIQNAGPTALGANGGGLGSQGLKTSVAIKFDTFSNTTEGPNSTGLFINGAAPYTPAIDLTASGVNLKSGHIFAVNLNYDGTTLTEVITDQGTGATQTVTYPVNIPTIVGANTAYVGFTGATGGSTSNQDIINWTYSPLPTTIPLAPTNLAATAVSGTEIDLAWTDNSTNESGFIIQRKIGATGTYAQVGVTAAGATTYPDTGLLPNTTYYYLVSATNVVGTSATTNEVFATTPVPPPRPDGAQAINITQTTISMTWNDNATNETGYKVLRKMTTASNFVQIADLPANTTSFTDTGLTPGTSYDYHIQCYNLAGYSDFTGFTAVTLGTGALPIITVSTPGGLAVNGIATGSLVFTANFASATSLSVPYTISGTGVPGTDYTALSGTAVIPPTATSVAVPVTALSTATSNNTVIASIVSGATFTAGSPASGTVVLENTTFNAAAGNAYGTSNVSGTGGGTVTLTFPGLPGNPVGTVYVWYLNGTAFATTTTASYTITNALVSQSGTYSVYAWAPGSPTNITGSASFAVTISPPLPVLSTSTGSVVVPDGSSVQFTTSLSIAPTTNTPVTVTIAGSPAVTVSPATITFTPTSYQNIPVTVTAAAINSNDSSRTSTVTLTTGTSTATVGVSDTVSDTQTAANLTAVTTPLTGSNLGSGSAGGSSVHASGLWWIDGSGAGGITGTADSFHFESQTFTGNFQMVVQLQSLTASGATSPLAGLMIRDGTAAGSNFVALAGQAASSGGYALVQRTTVNAAAVQAITSGAAPLTYTYPSAWMMLSRNGSVLHAFVSSDGVNYTEITNATTGITWTGISNALSIGVFSSSASTANARAVMSGFSISALATFTDADIGNPAKAGSATVNGSSITVTGGGADIWGGSDQFNYYSEPLTGSSQSLVIHVDSVAGADAWAKGGVMFRNSTTATSPFVDLTVVPSHQIALQWRDTESAGAATFAANLVGDTTTLKWLMLTKSGNIFTAYYATTTTTPGTSDWILAGTHTTTFAATTYLGGLAVTGHNNSVLGTAVFDSLAVSGSTVVITPPPPPPPPPVGFSDVDIGSPAKAGSATIGTSTITITGGGSDIWGNSDQFNYYSESVTGTLQSIVAHVDSVAGADSWAKGGVMFRNSSTATSPFVTLEAVPNKQVTLQWRDTESGAANSIALAGNTTSLKWLLLTKNGTTFTAYYATTTATPVSTDWVLAGTHTTTFASTNYLAGLAVTGHNNSVLGTSIFDSLSVTAATVVTPPAPPPPIIGYVDTDIGSPAVAGSVALNGVNVTVSGSGGDIWGNSDQFNYYYQQNTTDVTLTVHVQTVQNTNAWAKGGVMFRNSTTATSPFVVLEEVPNRQVSLQWRDTEGGGANSLATNLVGDTVSLKWLKLVKSGTTFTAYYATTATPVATDWILVGTHTTTFLSTPYLGGLSVTSHNNAVLGSTSFDTLSQQ